MTKLSKGELATKLAEAELKILNFKKKNKKLTQEVKFLSAAYDVLSKQYSSLEYKYDSAIDELNSQTIFGDNGN